MTLEKQNVTNKNPRTEDSLNFSRMINIANNLIGKSADTYKTYLEVSKEEQKTKRVYIEAERDINIAQKDLEKAQLKYSERLAELDKEDQMGSRQHEEKMAKHEEKMAKLAQKSGYINNVFDQLKEGKISAVEACALLDVLHHKG